MNLKAMRPKKLVWWQLVLGLVLIILGIFIWQKTKTPTAPEVVSTSTDDAALSVEAISPQVGQALLYLDAQGEIVGERVAQVSPRTQGVINEILVEEGDYVQKGQVLARLDHAQAQESARINEAEVYEAKIRLAKAESDLARITPLIEIDAISRQEADSYQLAKASAEAALASAEARRANQNLNLENTQIIAPVSGIISQKKANIGMSASGEPLFSIVVDGQLEWQARIRPEDAGAVAVGAPALVMIGANAIQGQVRRIGNTADGRDLLVRVSLPSDGGAVLGTLVKGKFVIGEYAAAALPSSAVMQSDGADFVWQIIKKDGKDLVKKLPIAIKERMPDGVIVSGLDETMKIVREGGAFLKDGDSVRVVATSAPTAGTPTQNAPISAPSPASTPMSLRHDAPSAPTPPASTPQNAPAPSTPKHDLDPALLKELEEASDGTGDGA